MQREVEDQLQQRASLSSEILNGGRALVDNVNHQMARMQLNHRTSSQQQTCLRMIVTTALDDSITSEMNDNEEVLRMIDMKKYMTRDPFRASQGI